ncbi:MAG: extracellular solute-binding protein [Candidatus Faecousia sp.]|nr:extracellular solute-binding protein [Candidatus Faecousia sp.]
MKKILALLLAVCMVLSLAACGAKTEAPAATEKPAETKATEAATEAPAEVKDITLKVWGPQEDQVDASSWLPTMCEQFNAEHPEWNITFVYEVCPEGDAGKNVTQDPSAAADVYMFANDQLGTLIQANAIAQLGGSYLDAVVADNSDSMIASVTGTDGGVYGVPFTGNTWFMYYDTSVFTEDDIKSLDTMLEKGKVSFPLTNSWYIASFFFANGGTIFGDAGIDAAAGVDFGGEKGTAVTEYLVNLYSNPNFVVDADGSGLAGLRDGSVNVLFSGTWDASAVREALGDNFGAAQLPTVTINGEAKQLQSFAGSKAIGVNPNCQNMQAAVALAVYLGSADAQLAHYEMRGIIPTSLALTSDPAIQADAVALAQANTIANTSVVQPSIPEMNNYWTPAENFGKAIVSGEVTLDNAAEKADALNSALNNSGL